MIEFHIYMRINVKIFEGGWWWGQNVYNISLRLFMLFIWRQISRYSHCSIKLWCKFAGGYLNFSLDFCNTNMLYFTKAKHTSESKTIYKFSIYKLALDGWQYFKQTKAKQCWPHLMSHIKCIV